MTTATRALPWTRWGRTAPDPTRWAYLLLVIVFTTFALRIKPLPLTLYDQPFYAGIAYDLRTERVFSDGFFFAPEPDGARPPGMRFTPLYPALLAAAAAIDPGLAAGLACTVHTPRQVPNCTGGTSIRLLQFALALATAWLIAWMAMRLTGSRRAGALSLLLLLPFSEILMRSAMTLMTETLALFLTTAATAAAIAAATGPRPRTYALLAGVLLGLAALTRPANAALLPLASLVLATLCLIRRARLLPSAAFLAGAALPLAPWLLRNFLVLGRPALTFGYASHTLVQRLAFDTMTGAELARFTLCVLPGGAGLARALAGPTACDRFGYNEHPDTFYRLGMGPMLDQTLAASGGYAHHMAYLVNHLLLRMPLWHALVSIPLAIRGLAIAHFWGLALFAVALVWTWQALRRADLPRLVLALPPLVLLALNAVVAVNQPRYNLALIPLDAIAGAALLDVWLDRAPWKRPPVHVKEPA